MAGKKEVRVKIVSTKKTMKITSAMKLVAAAKVNKMQKLLQQTRPYARKITELFLNLQDALSEDEIAANPLLVAKTEIKNVLLVVIASDRGLCGGYNANIVKAVNKRIKELSNQGKTIKLITVGRKARTSFSKALYKSQNIEIDKSFTNLSSMPTAQEASLIASRAIEIYLSGEVDKVEIISTNFVSLIASETSVSDFLPICRAPEKQSASGPQAEPFVLLEPDAKTLIDTIVPMYTENRIYQALVEATTSELAARMTAMSNATNNAKDFIKKLTLVFNKARQASITQEISEIVGGAAALG